MVRGLVGGILAGVAVAALALAVVSQMAPPPGSRAWGPGAEVAPPASGLRPEAVPAPGDAPALAAPALPAAPDAGAPVALPGAVAPVPGAAPAVTPEAAAAEAAPAAQAAPEAVASAVPPGPEVAAEAVEAAAAPVAAPQAGAGDAPAAGGDAEAVAAADPGAGDAPAAGVEPGAVVAGAPGMPRALPPAPVSPDEGTMFLFDDAPAAPARPALPVMPEARAAESAPAAAATTPAPAVPPAAAAQPAPPAPSAQAEAPSQADPAARPRPVPGFAGSAGVRTDRLPRIGDPPPEAAAAAVPDLAPDLPPLQRFARPFENPEGKPAFAILLIDTGGTQLDRAALAALPFAVTFALDPGAPEAGLAATIYRAAGQEVVMLATGLPAGAQAQDVEVTFGVHGAALPEAVAVMDPGSGGFQDDRQLATLVAPVIAGQGRGLVSWDRGLNPAAQIARRTGLPGATIFRDLDAQDEGTETIRRYLDRAAFRAAQEGAVLVAGRTRPETVAALLAWAVEGRASSVALAPLTAVLRAD